MSDTQSPVRFGATEEDRLRALASYEILDSPSDEHFDALAGLAARLCHCPMALITLVDGRRQWFKARVGIDLGETPRDIAFCAHTIDGEGIFQVNDTRADPRFADNPLVVGEPHLRFYAAVPLKVHGGHKLGSLAVLDRMPGHLSPQETTDLWALARQVVLALEERRLRLLAERSYAKARRQSESLLEIAGEVAMLGAWEFDVRRKKVVWSNVVADIHGMPRGFSPDLESALAFYVEPDRSILEAAVNQCLQRGTPFDFELVLQPAQGGKKRWVRSIGEAVKGPGGEITHLRGACQDITDRKSDQLEKQRLTDRLVATLESIPDPFLSLALDGTVEHVNAALERLVHRDRSELIGEPVERFLSDLEFTPSLARQCQDALASGKPIEYEAADGLHGHRFEVRIFPIEDGLTVHIRDITQREQTLSQLRLLDACVRDLNDVVMITDTHLDSPGPTIVFANPAALGLSGWQPHELIGESPRRLQGPLTQRDRLDALREAMRARQPFVTELINYRRSGELYWVELKLSPIHDATGRCTHFVAVQRDITERKLAESHRHALEQRLLQAQKMESIGTLAGGIAHDFNNILGAILGNVPLIRDALAPDSPSIAALSIISGSAQRARSLVEQILAFARRQSTHRAREPMRSLIEETVNLMKATLSPNVSLRTRLPPDEVFAEVDRNQIQQVLINLCTNAWQALPPVGGAIELGLDTTAGRPAEALGDSDPQAMVHLWVKDNGSGIDEKLQQRIFDPFFSTKAVGEGTGLGLSAAEGIVVSHGGSIGVDSKPGVGSVFHIHLPICEPPETTMVPERSKPAPVKLQGLHVLCVDDDPVMLMTMQALLQRDGCNVMAHLEAQAALDELRREPASVDLLVTDFNMPAMDGLSLIESTRQVRPDLPIVLASGYLSDELSARATVLGVNALMQKERTVEDLIDSVRAALAGKQAEAKNWPATG